MQTKQNSTWATTGRKSEHMPCLNNKSLPQWICPVCQSRLSSRPITDWICIRRGTLLAHLTTGQVQNVVIIQTSINKSSQNTYIGWVRGAPFDFQRRAWKLGSGKVFFTHQMGEGFFFWSHRSVKFFFSFKKYLFPTVFWGGSKNERRSFFFTPQVNEVFFFKKVNS